MNEHLELHGDFLSIASRIYFKHALLEYRAENVIKARDMLESLIYKEIKGGLLSDVLFLLRKVYDKLGDFDSAFNACEQGKSIINIKSETLSLEKQAEDLLCKIRSKIGRYEGRENTP
ncbi:MAG: hypothetical protein HON76_14080 [Candidatus Scalindua sp.]|jgi:tetratricopeptide (TPR) repeat protein|nr:hypothetical protein [Candidatus Scalindua sp.]MBT5306157.1 hypothetical protein [Candidatus Scalindua sp.]MBT6230368.1 hypothetical protein [Candidatus Scalindua sp.]MBT6563647.1 hypothetical protein [Candidatus Scalindua sp.]MBT7210073.1 hypothetical protein [Candidatus Scalindua sp.]